MGVPIDRFIRRLKLKITKLFISKKVYKAEMQACNPPKPRRKEAKIIL